ncbi:hypothetical protein PENSPDRAFT_646839 [Peniophora sp. CONT]|nr:hypothetical protein PENSPDRAFT_646839 [Peniophora sp. CONT]
MPRLGQLIENIAAGILFVQLADHCDSALALCNADCDLREGAHNRRSLDAEVRRASQTLISARELLDEMQRIRDRLRMEARVEVFDNWMLQKLDQRVEAFDRVHETMHRTAGREVGRLRASILARLKANRSE